MCTCVSHTVTIGKCTSDIDTDTCCIFIVYFPDITVWYISASIGITRNLLDFLLECVLSLTQLVVSV